MMKEMNVKEMAIVNGGNTEFGYVTRDFGDWAKETGKDLKKGLEDTGKGIGFLFKTFWNRIFG